ncbi:hypothetical protein RF11_07676 [Thelohanellus kitauei]|uniref:Uncharacterized protein n=1 Tax=Thelohanellus kitauei TaxID=669202 RepID=A0A0C2MJM4_THEKT|nr:hypothetical protein RF11_07676 [Thelohanellus kitauei]
MNNILNTFYEQRGHIPIYHEVLTEEIKNRLVDKADFVRVISTNKKNILKHIFSQQIYAEENPFVGLCYLKQIRSVILRMLRDTKGIGLSNIDCFSLMKSLKLNAPKLSAVEISTAINLISQSKKTLERGVAAYKYSVDQKKLGNLDILIEQILKDKSEEDEIFKIVATHTMNLLSKDETSSKTIGEHKDPIYEFVVQFEETTVARPQTGLTGLTEAEMERLKMNVPDSTKLTKKNGDTV